MSNNQLGPGLSHSGSRHTEQHEEALAPGLAPWGNASEFDGANRLEPSRGSAPAPPDSNILAPVDSSEASHDPITWQQSRQDRKRGLVAPQPQPTINTKAVEATSYSVPRHVARPSGIPDEDRLEHDAGNSRAHNNFDNRQSIRGSIYDEATPYRQYHTHPADEHERLPVEEHVDTLRDHNEKDIAPSVLQPTNEGTNGADNHIETTSDLNDNDSQLAEGTIEKDDEDPDAVYRVTNTVSNPFSAPADSVRLTKEELKAEKLEQKARKRQKLVRDPVTGHDIWIENARGSTKKIIANDGVVAPKYKETMAQSERSAAQVLSLLHKIPFKDDKTNLLFYPMNPPEWRELQEESQHALFQWAYIMIFVFLTVQVFLSIFPFGYALWLNAVLAIGSILFLKNALATRFAAECQNSERVRGEHATLGGIPESVEWLNNILRTIWPTINPELFGSLIDLLEDVLQKQVPNVVHTVKVSDLDIGSIPLRILSMRFLPDDGTPRGDEDAAGEYVNLEVTFGYRGQKTDKSLKSKAKNIHMLIWFLVGLRNVLGIPIPIWVEIHGIVGRARVRIQLLPDPPFLKNGTITLLGMPKIELVTVPIMQNFINVMNLPFVSQLVSFAVKTVLKDLIAPRSYTMDVSKLMVGDDVKKETASIGILMICIHGATDVPRSDHRPGRSKVDPYATIQYSRFGKTLYSTRVISQDYNPVWEETCFLPVMPGAVKAGEKIRINLWDSDRITADDLLGRIEIDLTNLVIHPGTFERRIDNVIGCQKTQLHWSIGFFGKKAIPDQDVPPLRDSRIPPELKNTPGFRDVEPAWSVDSKTEQLICRTPPDKEYPGLVSIQIHQINDLGVVKPKAALHTRDGRVLDAEAVEQGKEDDSGTAPSAYCSVSLNDELVYKTRTRAYTTRPIFNASFERFVRSFADTRIRISVRDQRFREDDPIIGILALALSEELCSQGQVTRWYPLSEGIGYGHIRVSLLFRNIDCKIPRTLQGWNVGTLHIFGVKAVVESTDAEALQDCSLRIDTMLGHKTIGAVHSAKSEDGNVEWDLGGTLVMPIRRRHATSLNLEAHRGGVPFTKKGLFSGIYGACIIALSALEDDYRDRVRIPIFQTDDYVRFKQNSLTQYGEAQDRALRKLGYMEVDCVLNSGLSNHHRKFIKRSSDIAQTHEAWETEKSLNKRLAHDSRQTRSESSTFQKRDLHDINEDVASDSIATKVEPSTLTEPAGGLKSRTIHFGNDDGSGDLEAILQNGHVAEDNDNDNNQLVTTMTRTEHESDWASDDGGASLNSRTSGHRSFRAWVADKAADRRERHRRHRGIMQQKPARTASWMKNGLRRGISKASRALSLNREDNLVEREV